MRVPIVVLLVIAAALLAETQAGKTQSPNSYPWCAIPSGGDNSGGGAMSCYYMSWEQCMTTLSGIGETVSRALITMRNRHRCSTIRQGSRAIAGTPRQEKQATTR
jgi:Tfp pilus assembly protein PilV